MGFAGLFVIGLLVLIVGGLIYGIILMSGGGSRGGSAEMSCGGCGYAVRGLEALNCPECGGDLRQIGINRGQRSGSRGAGITLVVLCGGCLLFSAFSFLMFSRDVSPSKPVNIPSMPSQPAPNQSASSSQIENADGSNTIVNPDGSKIVSHPDGSSTLIQPDGTMTTFNSDGVEIPNPEPQDNGAAVDGPADGESP